MTSYYVIQGQTKRTFAKVWWRNWWRAKTIFCSWWGSIIWSVLHVFVNNYADVVSRRLMHWILHCKMLPFPWVEKYMNLTPLKKTVHVAHFMKSKLMSLSNVLSGSGGKYDTTKEDEVKKVLYLTGIIFLWQSFMLNVTLISRLF